MKKNLQKYVNDMPVPPANKVLPQECLKADSKVSDGSQVDSKATDSSQVDSKVKDSSQADSKVSDGSQAALKTTDSGQAVSNVTDISHAKSYRKQIIGGLSAALLVSAAAFTFMVLNPLDSAQEKIGNDAASSVTRVETPNKINVSKPGKDSESGSSDTEFKDGVIGERKDYTNGGRDDLAFEGALSYEGKGLVKGEVSKSFSDSDGIREAAPAATYLPDSDPVMAEPADGSAPIAPADEPEPAAPAPDIAVDRPIGDDPDSMPEVDPWDEPVINDLQEAKAGILTGGELRDLKNWDNYLHSMDKNILDNWTFCPKNRIAVTVLTSEGMPAADFKVSLMAGDKTVYEAVTNNEGIAYLFHSYNGADAQSSYDTIAVTNGNFKESYKTSDVVNSKGEAEIKIEDTSVKSVDIKKLQIMYVIDTTGSMGDELEYLKAELKDVISRVDEAVAEKGIDKVSTSVNFYRDEDDEYVVKYYDFRDDPKEVSELINQQDADGGGDFPEAVHTALKNAIEEHSWADDGSIKIMFLVLDAPPHDDPEVKKELVSLIEKASAKGIRVIPIAASGADEETHQILRAMSVMTGGTYVFLDDNSGIGYGHETPVKEDEYSSEYLNDMMIRIILEYCGIDYEGTKVEKPTEKPQGQ